MFSLNYRTAAVLGVLVVMAVTTLAGCSSSSGTSTAPGDTPGSVESTVASSDKASGFSGTLLDGTPVALSDYLGKPVILAFMASW
jgi:hypothetical protein